MHDGVTSSGTGQADRNSSSRAIGRDAGRTLEFVVGLLVLVALAALLALALVGSDRKASSGYTLSARFPHIDGLGLGSEVKLAGVSVGQVTAERVDPKTYQAVVSFTVADGIKLPDDSSAVVTSDSLLGGKYLALSPGGSETMLKPGGQIGLTQGSISLEQLLSKFIFSVTDAMSAKKSGAEPAPAAAGSTPSLDASPAQTAPAPADAAPAPAPSDSTPPAGPKP